MHKYKHLSQGYVLTAGNIEVLYGGSENYSGVYIVTIVDAHKDVRIKLNRRYVVELTENAFKLLSLTGLMAAWSVLAEVIDE